MKKTAETFGISLNTVYRYLRELEKNTVIEKTEKGFRLVKIENIIPLSRSDCEKIGEDMVYKKYVKHYLCYLPDQVIRIWQYSFMEMMNNAIEHSEGKQVTIYISRDCLATDIIILDDGIGIFKKIKEYYHYTTLESTSFSKASSPLTRKTIPARESSSLPEYWTGLPLSQTARFLPMTITTRH